MDGLPIKKDIDSAPTVFAGYFDVCLAGFHGDGSAFFPDGQCIPVVAGKNIAAGATN
jgi:hypothetical protein